MYLFANPLVIMLWGILAFIFYLNWRGHFSPRRFWHFGPYTTLVYSFLVLYLFTGAITYHMSSRKSESVAEKLEQAEYYKDVVGEIRLIKAEFDKESLNLKWGIPLMDAYAKLPDADEYEPYRDERKAFLQELIESTVLGLPCEKSFSAHLLVYWYLKNGDRNKAFYFAEPDYYCSTVEFKLLRARAIYGAGETDQALALIHRLLDEMADPTEAFEWATVMIGQDASALEALVHHPRAIKYFNFGDLTKFWIEKGEWLNYFQSFYFGILLRYHPLYVLISLLVSVVVGYYLYSLDVFDRDSLGRLVAMFLLGCAIVPLTLFVYDMYDNGWGWYKGFVGNSLWLYQIFHVGLTEEFIKMIVLLVAVYVFKWANEPLDYIIYAAIGALSFAFLENTMYFDDTDGDVVFTRTIFSTIGHVFDSCIIAYGLAVNRFRYQKKIPVVVLIPVLLLVAAVWHGTFNTILSLGLGFTTFYIFIPLIIVIMAFLGGMINNAINNSPHFDKHLIGRNDKGVNLIATAFICLYIVQQVILIYLSDRVDQTAWRMLNTMVLVGVLVMILSYYLGIFDIVRGEWTSFLAMIFRRKTDRNVALGLNCEIYTSKIEEVHHYTDYLFGRITDRVVIKGDNAFFLVRLITPYTFNGEEYKSVLIHHKRSSHRIMLGVEMFVHFVVPIKKKFSLAKSNRRSDFEYVGEAYIICSESIQTIPDDLGLIHREEGNSTFLV